MSRRRSTTSTLIRLERDSARALAQESRARAQAQAAQARAQVAQLRAVAADDRERKRLYSEARAAEVAADNADLTDRIAELEGLLAAGLARDAAVNFRRLKQPATRPPATYLQYETSVPPPDPAAFVVPEPSGLGKLFGRAKYEQAASEAQQALQDAVAEHAAVEQRRIEAYRRARAHYDSAVVEAHAQAVAAHAEVDALETGYQAGNAEEIVAVVELALASSPYPIGFEQQFRTAFVPESRQLVVEYELPTADVVPRIKTYRYVKAGDTVSETARPVTQVRAVYGQVVAQITLRTLHEVFAADPARHIDTVVFNGVVDTVDPGSGQRVRPCVVTVRTTRDAFAQLDLGLVEPLACLRHLSASVSKSPAELVPVRPVVEFSMLDPRFVAESDALSVLDERPNLLELSPTEFEVLIQNLFTKMGLEARQTRASRDGGVDCVAYDTRPIFGGKVVIQAKRYRHTVGVSAVRDLYGTLQNEGASKGILVTTSGYGPASFEFAKNKPIELIDGGGLLYLLKTHADVDARIEAPDGWVDPRADVPESSP